MENIPKKVIIDTDPGVDDSLALLLAARSRELEILGISVVCGNTTTVQGTRNARDFLDLIGRPDIEVYPGCERPLKFELTTAEDIHGLDGLGGVKMRRGGRKTARSHAVEFIKETLRLAPKEITIVTLGPLTNIASLFLDDPRSTELVKEMFIMGGCLCEGNITKWAEFNIYADPHAASVVISAPVKKTLIGLDVTHKALFSDEEALALKKVNDEGLMAASQLLRHLLNVHEKLWGKRVAPMHDPLAVACAIDDSLVIYDELCLSVNTSDSEFRGRITRRKSKGKKSEAVRFGMGGNLERFKKLFLQNITGKS